MAAFFLDTSAIVERYVQEAGTAWLQALTSPAAGHALFIVRIAQVEAIAALRRQAPGAEYRPGHPAGIAGSSESGATPAMMRTRQSALAPTRFRDNIRLNANRMHGDPACST